MKSGEFILKYRWPIIILSIAIPVAVGLAIFRAQIDPDLEKYIPENMSSRLATEEIEQVFGGDELMILVFKSDDVLKPETLKRIKNIRKDLIKLDGVDQVMSLFDVKNLKNEEGTLITKSFFETIPETKEEIENVRKDLLANNMARDIVVSEDFTLATIIMSLNDKTNGDDLVASVEEIIKNNPGPEKIYLGGLPYMRSVISGDIAKDMKRFMVIGLIIMLVMLYIFLRDIRGVLLPFAVVILSIIFSIGLLPLIGWKLSIISLLLPVMLIAIANNYGIHLIAKYQEINWTNGGISNEKLAEQIFSNLKIPIFLTGITTVAGFLSLLTHKMIPAKQLGIISAIGIAFALLISLCFIPAVLSFLKKKNIKQSTKNGDKRILDRILERIAVSISLKPARVLITTGVIVLITGVGILFLKVDTNVEKFFPEKHPVRQSAAIINKVFGGSQNLSVHMNGDIMDPEVMKKIDYYTEDLKSYPGVGNVMSISSVIREISKVMNNPGDELYDKIPDNREAIAQYLLLYSMNGNPEDLEKLIDFNYENAQIMIRINDGSNEVINNVIGKVQRLTKGDPNVKTIGGYGYVVAQLANLVVRGQISSLLVSLIICAIILAIAFRSIYAGLTGIIPIAVSLVVLFGLMGYFRISLDIATALLSSIMIGVGIDYTIHFLWRYKTERLNGLDSREAVVKTLTTTGRGITFNALGVIIGFCVLPFSSFSPIRFFGFLVIISIFACLVGALVIVPSLVLVVKPRFLEVSRLKLVGRLKPTGIGLKPTGIGLKPTGIGLKPTGIGLKPTGIDEVESGEHRQQRPSIVRELKPTEINEEEIRETDEEQDGKNIKQTG
jgi:hydrophobe/amphiphile efflux-3 (HAE3) family protein